jgi:hypothetical protein
MVIGYSTAIEPENILRVSGSFFWPIFSSKKNNV